MGCNTGTTRKGPDETQGAGQDSTEVPKDLREQDVYDVVETNPDSVQYAMENEVSEIIETFQNGANNYLTLRSQFSGYESGSQATWYVDSVLALKFCEASWDAEGGSGRYTFYFDGGDLVAGREETSYDETEEIILVHKAFKPVYGFTRREVDSDNEPEIVYLDQPEFMAKQSFAHNEYQRILALIKEYEDSVITGDGDVHIHIENVVDYGESFTEKADYTLDSELFRKLVSAKQASAMTNDVDMR